MEIYVKAAVNDPPKDGDILDIVVVMDGESIESANTSDHSPLNQAFQEIRNYMDHLASKSVGLLAPGAEYDSENPNGTSYYFPFKVISEKGTAYPLKRRFYVRVTYKYTSLGDVHDIEVQPHEKATDFGTVFIDGKKKRYPQIVTDAKAFIDKKVKEVRESDDPASL